MKICRQVLAVWGLGEDSGVWGCTLLSGFTNLKAAAAPSIVNDPMENVTIGPKLRIN
jgi:hypothetical protein